MRTHQSANQSNQYTVFETENKNKSKRRKQSLGALDSAQKQLKKQPAETTI